MLRSLTVLGAARPGRPGRGAGGITRADPEPGSGRARHAAGAAAHDGHLRRLGAALRAPGQGGADL